MIFNLIYSGWEEKYLFMGMVCFVLFIVVYIKLFDVILFILLCIIVLYFVLFDDKILNFWLIKVIFYKYVFFFKSFDLV